MPECLSVEKSTLAPPGAQGRASYVDRLAVRRRGRNEIAAELVYQGKVGLARSVQQCGDSMLLVEQEGSYKVREGRWCNQRLLCDLCGWRRTRKLLAWLGHCVEQHPGGPWWHLVCTVKGGPDVRERLAAVNRGRKGLLKAWAREYGQGRGVLGSCGSVEVTPGREGAGWHVHLHWLVLGELDQASVRRLWAERVGDGSYICNLQGVTDPTRAVLEVAKYCVKPATLTAEQRVHVALALRRSRLMFASGVLRGKQEWERDSAKRGSILGRLVWRGQRGYELQPLTVEEQKVRAARASG